MNSKASESDLIDFENTLTPTSFKSPVNLSLQNLTKKSFPSNICPEHEEEASLICITDCCRICPFCERSDKHKGHIIKTVEEVIAQTGNKVSQLEDLIIECLHYQKILKEVPQDDKNALVGIINEVFGKLRKLLDEKEKAILNELNVYLEAKKLRVAKIIEKDNNFIEDTRMRISDLLVNDINSKVLRDLKVDVKPCKSKMEYILLKRYNQIFNQKEFEDRLNSFSMGFADKIQKIILPFNVQTFKRNMKNTYIENKNNQEILNTRGLIGFQKEANQLSVFLQNSSKNLEIPIEKLKEVNRITLDLTNYSELEKGINAKWQEISFIMDCLGQRLEKDSKITFKFIIGDIPIESFSKLMHCDFWQNKNIKKKLEISVVPKLQVGEESLIDLATKVFPKIQGGKELLLDLTEWKNFTDKGIEALITHNNSEMKKLKYLELRLNDTLVTDLSLKLSSTNLKSVKIFKLYLWNTKITDKGVESFNMIILPTMKCLEHLELNFGKTQVTDESISQLFKNMKEDVKVLKIGLWDTKITNSSIEAFTSFTLPKMKALNQLELSLGETGIVNQKVAELFLEINPEISFRAYLNDDVHINDSASLKDVASDSYGFLKRLKNKLIFG